MLLHRMSDECLMKLETVFPFYTQYQAVMRKFTLAGKSVDVRVLRCKKEDGRSKMEEGTGGFFKRSVWRRSL